MNVSSGELQRPLVMAAAAHAHLIKMGEIPPDEPGEAEGQEANPANSPEFMSEANAAAPSPAEVAANSGFLYLNEL